MSLVRIQHDPQNKLPLFSVTRLFVPEFESSTPSELDALARNIVFVVVSRANGVRFVRLFCYDNGMRLPEPSSVEIDEFKVIYLKATGIVLNDAEAFQGATLILQLAYIKSYPLFEEPYYSKLSEEEHHAFFMNCMVGHPPENDEYPPVEIVDPAS